MDSDAARCRINQFITAIYGAASTPKQWQPLLSDLCNFFCLQDMALVFVDAKILTRNLVITTKNSSNSHHVFMTGDAIKKLRDELERYPPGTLIAPNIINTLALDNDAKNQWISVLHSPFIIPLFVGNAIYAMLLLQNDGKEFPRENKNILTSLIPHLIKAIHIHNHISALECRNDALLDAFHRNHIPVFILNSELVTIFISREADMLLKRNPAITLSKRRHLHLYFPDEQNALQKMLKNFLSASCYSSYQVDKEVGLVVRHPDLHHPLQLCFVPLQKPGINNANAPFIAILVNDPEQPRQIAPEYLKQAFHLTPAEIHAAQLLVSGYSIADIAEHRGTTLETTRGQIKQLLQKTHTHSQSELVRLLIVLGNDLDSGHALLDIPLNDFHFRKS